ncbi:putative thiamine biosynthesis oxidoreductase ThiO isoform X2 [Mangifera indica]|uniref:putative thiamine biosynthesis oxidoreductase ThiO isoform X2 n=1 Tax=Mangifera indica TaxID=29780 RepID=UPI001CFAF2D4|nr:putative thiamine biosynthesis oxidoreductase ThiO isoform X2 [Mangifera indica]
MPARPPPGKSLLAKWSSPFIGDYNCCRHCRLHSRRMTSLVVSSHHQRPLRYAVLGAGFAGLSVAWHLLKESAKELSVCVDIYDEIGIGGGASGVSGGLLHPYSPKEAAIGLEEANSELEESGQDLSEFVIRRRGILRPATNMKTLNTLNDNAQNCLSSCRIETIDKDSAQRLVPNLCVPLNTAFYMPDAVNVHPQHYLQGLFLACKNLVKGLSSSGFGRKELYLHQKSISNLLELKGEYDAVIVCMGAKADMLPELSGRLPLRTCRGVIACLQLPGGIGQEYPDDGPSILADAWLAVQGTRSLYVGSTWEWKSRNSSPKVSVDEASKALEELLPKASSIYPGITNWSFTEARAGLRAMPPLTVNGSLPLLGCIEDLIGKTQTCKYWLFGGLGSRGLLYHAWLGKLMAQAVLSCDERIIPPELTAWKKINR